VRWIARRNTKPEEHKERMCIKPRRTIGLLILSALASLVLSCGGSSRPAGLVLVISQGAADVTSYGIDLNTGTLTHINSAAPVPANTIPTAIVLDPAGSFAYVAAQASGGAPGSISAYSVASSGKLSPAGNSTATGVNPVALAMDKGGHFLFVANQGNIPAQPPDISVFSIAANATLTAVPGSPFQLIPATPGSSVAPSGVAITPSGVFLYVSNSGENSLSGFKVDSSSGALTAVPGSPFATGSSPIGVAIDPSGKYLYVANEGSNNVSAFEVCASALPGCSATDGSLVSVTGSPFSAGLGPISLAADPSGNFVYVADTNSNQLSAYRINLSTGALTPLTTPTESTGTNPTFVAVHPGGNFVYVPNSGSDSISGFRLTTQSGVLTPLATASTASHPVGVALK
jgi:6-phosphogluconolactonase